MTASGAAAGDMRRALVIGSGYLGERVARELVAGGWRVLATSRREERLRELERLGVGALRLDAACPRASLPLAEPLDLVIYCVAPGRGEDPRVAYRDGPLATLDALAAVPPARFVYVSSTGVFDQRDGSWVDESSPAVPSSAARTALREAEEALLRGEPPARAIVARLAGIYGPARSPVDWVRDAEFRDRLRRRSPSAFTNWIRVEDAAPALVAIAERGRPGELYLVSDDCPVLRRDFFGLAAELAGAPPLEWTEDPGDRGRRVSNRKLREELGVELRYPDYRSGLASLATANRAQGRDV